MTARVMLVSPAMNQAAREHRFDDGAPLDPAGLRQARAAAHSLPRADRHLCAPTARSRETAAALGLDARPASELHDLDVGAWQGLTLDEVTATAPEAVATWLSDCTAAPHGGESVAALIDRIGTWLEAQGADAGRVLAVAEPAVIRAAVVHALDLPVTAFWRLDVQPLSLTKLSGRSRRWNLQCGLPLARGGGA
ncbi:phosphoglycerate mutase [Streptomyces sp. NRRL B-1568]|nr:phosphoglycerate mutase [Streptomyces sp. NRRL B-1568]